MCDTAPGERGLDRFVDEIVDVRGSHDPLVEYRDVDEHFVEVDVLLVVRADQVVEGVAGDCEHRLSVALGIVEPVEQMDAAGSRRRQADAQPASEFRVAAGGKCRRLLVAHLDESDAILPGAQRFEDTVHAIAGKSEDGVHIPLDESFDEEVGGGLRHC